MIELLRSYLLKARENQKIFKRFNMSRLVVTLP